MSNHTRSAVRLRRAACAAVLSLAMLHCASSPDPLTAMDREIEVERFMGDWYVIAFIPIDLPFFSEAGAHDAVENYRLEEEGEIDITYTFRDGSFDAEPTVMKQRGRVLEEGTGTEWRVQVFWPFESAYLIAWVDDEFQRAIVGVPSRSNVWLLSREARLPESEVAALMSRAEALGYESESIQRVPHRALESGMR